MVIMHSGMLSDILFVIEIMPDHSLLRATAKLILLT